MKILFRQAIQRGLLWPWLGSLAAMVVLFLTKNYWLTVVVACVVVAGTIVQLRKTPIVDRPFSWDAAVDISRPRPPRIEQVDREHPLVALVVKGDKRGVYVNVIPAGRIADWIYQIGPTAWGPSPGDSGEAGEVIDDDAAREDWTRALRYLPQGGFADEIWRRNFDSLWRGPRFRVLPRTKSASRRPRLGE